MSLDCAALARTEPAAMPHETFHGDDYVARIFGPKNFMAVDRVNRLPGRLQMLYAGLTQ